MCGRFIVCSSKEEIEAEFGAAFMGNFKPRYNAAPAQELPVVVTGPPRAVRLFRWGLIPEWAKALPPGAGLINARAETIAEKPSFRDSFREKRCLVVANGYYEWQKSGKIKAPHCIMPKAGGMLAFAGLWSVWRGNGITLETFAIITVSPCPAVAAIHDRMPVIIEKKYYEKWLSAATGSEEALAILAPYGGGNLAVFEVSLAVNSAKNDSPELIRPLR